MDVKRIEKRVIEVKVEETIEDEGGIREWHTFQLLSASIDGKSVALEEIVSNPRYFLRTRNNLILLIGLEGKGYQSVEKSKT